MVILEPALTGVILAGTTSSKTIDIDPTSIPVAAGTRLLMVYSITAAGISLSNDVYGYASAGVEIN
jgi:hypothetical protein